MNANGWVSPDALVEALEAGARELDGLGKDLRAAHNELSDAELDWDQTFDETMTLIEEEYEEDGKRLPGEDVRRSLVRRRGGWNAWARFRKAERQVKLIDKQISVIDKAISARQSELKQMQAEIGAAA